MENVCHHFLIVEASCLVLRLIDKNQGGKEPWCFCKNSSVMVKARSQAVRKSICSANLCPVASLCPAHPCGCFPPGPAFLCNAVAVLC